MQAQLDSEGRTGIWHHVDKLEHADDAAHAEAHEEDNTQHDFALANARRAAQMDANKVVEEIKAALAAKEGCMVRRDLSVIRMPRDCLQMLSLGSGAQFSTAYGS